MSEHPTHDPWITEEDAALLVDQYELTMAQAYVREEMDASATFSLYIRSLPESRNYYLAAGLDDALRYLENVRFTEEALAYLDNLGTFSPDFLDWLTDFEFTGDVYAMPEGTPFFPDEPVLEVEGPIVEAQIAETFLMNQVHFQTLLASKASRVVRSAGSSSVVDFGLRRTHGTDAGLKAARACYVAGVDATSNVLAGRVYGVPVTGTMAHSYIQSHERELEAFRSFAECYPDTILLVDTYDTMQGVERVIDLADELGDAFQVRGIRLDSGDLGQLARDARERLDEAGLEAVDIFASGGLDEWAIRDLEADAPIDGYGVGTRMGVSRDLPGVDMAYKLTEYAGAGRLKRSRGKKILPGRKQVYRIEENGRAVRDVLARAGEDRDGRPLLNKVMQEGKRCDETGDLDHARQRAERERSKLPDRIRSIDPADPPYPVEVSEALRKHQQSVIEEVERTR